VAQLHIEDILVDLGYCEKKSCVSCFSLIVQYPERDIIVEVLTPVVTEEWSHFERVLHELRKRGYGLGPQRKDEYITAISKIMKKGGSREQQLVEKLLMNALIEARSCERFKMLSQGIDDPSLSAFYHELMISEAGHYKLFLSLAKEYMEEDRIMNRWREWLAEEAKIVATLQPRLDRLH
jgi:tRNA-(ms[2]io[6]A)-hydroxylase